MRELLSGWGVGGKRGGRGEGEEGRSWARGMRRGGYIYIYTYSERERERERERENPLRPRRD